MLTRQVKVAKFEALQEADQIVPRLFGRGSASSLKRGSVLQLIPACAGMTGGVGTEATASVIRSDSGFA